jgi:hypothetical protein
VETGSRSQSHRRYCHGNRPATTGFVLCFRGQSAVFATWVQAQTHLSSLEEPPYDEAAIGCVWPGNGSLLLEVPKESASGSAGVGPSDSCPRVRPGSRVVGKTPTESAFLTSSAEWCAKPFFSSSDAQFAADARSGAIASSDTTDFISSSSLANRRTWARSCVVVFPSSATS